MTARWRRRLSLFLDGLLGPPCRHGCDSRVFAADVRAHEDTNHAGDRPSNAACVECGNDDPCEGYTLCLDCLEST